MARPWIADGDHLQIWKVIANIYAAESGGPSTWWLGEGLISSYHIKIKFKN